ncbi:MAG TPA: zf-HC2 domain-containing protein [Actinomycetota bacterium]|nr:zf-HC2 domain-containing protein [Actinomycetota bacterium]
MNCLTVRERLAEHALGVLSASELSAVDRHLEWCAACRKEAGELQGAAATLAFSVAPVEPPGELEDRVLEAVRGVAGTRRAAAPRRSRVAAAGVLAAVLALSGLAWGAVMAGRADRLRDQILVQRARQEQAFENFQAVIDDLEGADPANIVEVTTLEARRARPGGGEALVLLSPSSDDFALVALTGLTDVRERRFPLEVRLVTDGAGASTIGQVSSLDPTGSVTLSRWFVESLRDFDAIEVRDARGRVLLRGALSVQAPTA